ncbi:hypothetical protein ACIQ9E_15860 [Streptomyces sp. NPDC094448]|uniref:hypothetical protein n=1 Tax=Streptomyces sp. NPDC094448 TaxID=3366063 RepID=UPI003811E31B
MPARRRIAVAIAAAALTVPIVAGCSAVDKALDCVDTAEAVTSSIDNLQTAVSSAAEDPTKAREALEDIDKELKELDDKTDNADLEKAVKDLDTGIDNIRKAIEDGENTVDTGPLRDAGKEIGKVCTP